MKAIAIILAAGESQRMGIPKALLAADDGSSFLGRLVQTFAACGVAPLVVVGAHAAQIQAAHPTLPFVLNPHWSQGQFSSVQVGLRAALAQGAQRLLIQPVDIPLISTTTVGHVTAALAQSPAVLASFKGKPGHPLGLQAAAARVLLASNARTLEEATHTAVGMAVEDAAILDNLNTPEAYLLRFGHNPRAV